MSDWQKGDLALCIKQGPWLRADTGTPSGKCEVKAGMILSVHKVGMLPVIGKILWFEGIGGQGLSDSYAAHRFRKIPPHTPDAEDAETIALLNGERVPDKIKTPAAPQTAAGMGRGSCLSLPLASASQTVFPVQHDKGTKA